METNGTDDTANTMVVSPELPAPTGIDVRYSHNVPDKHPSMFAHLLKVEVVRAVGYPEKIFVFQRSGEGTVGEAVDEFIQIATPSDIDEVPEDAPMPDKGMPYYRTSKVELLFRCLDDLELAKHHIGEDIKALVNTYDVINAGFDREETIHYGK